MGANLDSEILRSELEKLVGLPVWGVGLSAGMLGLSFGNRYPVKLRSGRMGEDSDFGLHVQCAWRVAREDEVVVGYAGYMAIDEDDAPALKAFYETLCSVFAEGPKVEAVTGVRAGAFSLCLEGGVYVEVFPSAQDVDPDAEFWRLMPREPRSHFVVGPSGLEVD